MLIDMAGVLIAGSGKWEKGHVGEGRIEQRNHKNSERTSNVFRPRNWEWRKVILCNEWTDAQVKAFRLLIVP